MKCHRSDSNKPTPRKPVLTVRSLQEEAAAYAEQQSSRPEPSIYGITDGKAIGTYFEHGFRIHLQGRYSFKEGSSASGIDFPSLNVDMKVTSIKQPQSSCPFSSARQKIFGLGYALLVFVYEKIDDAEEKTGLLNIQHVVFVEKERTADFQTTKGIQDTLKQEGNVDDLTAFILDRHLPVDEIGAAELAEQIIETPPELGYLTISNALQWRLQYRRIIEQAGEVPGIVRLR